MSWLSGLFGKDDVQEPKSSANMKRVSGDTYELRIRGTLNKATVDNIQEIGVREIEKGATSLKLLVMLDDFRGWQRSDNWEDIEFFATHGDRIARIAVVGDGKWETESLMFLGAGRRKGEVKFFPSADEAKARGWLAGGLK